MFRILVIRACLEFGTWKLEFPMIIGIDASRAVNEQAGIGRYTREIVQKMLEIDKEDQFRLLFTFIRGQLPASGTTKRKWIDELETNHRHVKIRTIPLPGRLKEWLWGQGWWTIERFMPGSDVIFAPSFFEAAVGEKIPQVVTMHDCSHAIFPFQRGKEVSKRLSECNKLIVRQAVRMVVPSQATKNDLIRLFSGDPERIAVIPHGYNDFFQVVKGVKREPFFLFVGTVSPRKNLVGLFEAYAKLPKEIGNEYILKVAGASGWNTGEIYDTYRRLGLGERVEFLGHQNDEELLLLYNRAAAFVFPSLYEGFGLPILEAMACGCPVITSNVSSMPEAAGEAALLVDPGHPKKIAQAMERIVTEPKLWAKLHRSGLERVKHFSWERCARETLNVIHEVGR